MKLIALSLLFFSIQAQAVNPFTTDLETALQKTARRFAYEDTKVTCGGKVLAYQVIQELNDSILVQAKISADVQFCEKRTDVTCNIRYSTVTSALEETSISCQLP